MQKIATFSLVLKHLLNLLDAEMFFSVDFLNTCLLSFESPGPGEFVRYLCRALRVRPLETLPACDSLLADLSFL